MRKKIILAYSGGLDTSYAISYLSNKYDCDVIALLVEVGEEKDIKELETRALKAGALRCHVVQGKKDLAHEYLSLAIKANSLYEGVYPLVSALSRALISKYLVDVAKKESAFAVAHGCTAKGNDQIRFDVSIRALAPEIKVIAPLREQPINRQDAIKYVEERGIDIPVSKDKPYSIDMNIWGRSCECGMLEDPWNEPPEDAYELTCAPETAPNIPEYIELRFEKGLPVAINGEIMELDELIPKLNKIAGAHGVGRIDHIENRVVGIKSREVYETPAASTIITAHKGLETLCMTKDVFHHKQIVEQKIANLIYEGLCFSPLFEGLKAFVNSTQDDIEGVVRMKLYKGNAVVVGKKSEKSLYNFSLSTYDPSDSFNHGAAEGFVSLWGLPLEIYANTHRKVKD